ncbi:DNA helicase RecQ [Chlorobium phaeobacteroides]|uniref:DNA helicase RecQ n=1 Tax=Chlorobium phaeobacteroides (strain DSM 266 / SMG 266 / 2430) TaxID=290317 RepID=A1BCJ6_CHLPD|nr:DNA helicase RecQ [Chlorobium phaeobacteroides]ABL64123.1 ATP-dependent DNA helicase RecQ [Chlorobium phaeobacteroides DSM 266]
MTTDSLNPEKKRGCSDAALYETLRKVFGFRDFRPNQEMIVRTIIEKRDVFAVMPTGGGKSLCYQLPAVLLPGTCMVISPLIALMKDQVDGARANGIRAAFLNSSLAPEERTLVLRDLLSNSLDLLYVAPERFTLDQFQEMLKRVNISMAVIDEAHCISEWGHDFRPDYLSLSQLVTLFPDLPVAAFTATATHQVQRDILDKLALRNPFVVRASFDRANLYYDIRFKENASDQLVALLKQNSGKAGIIYRTSRKSVNETAALLKAKGFRVLPYHAGLGDDERKQNQEAFIRDEVDVIVATVAFGMGIDKSNIRFVIHADLPKSIENYYQETGRAGRDGEAARCTLLFSQSDIPKVRFFIDAMQDETERARALGAFSKVISFASTSVCRRKTLLDYFGETYPHDNCNSCDICLGTREVVDCSLEAQMLLSAIARTEERFGATHIVDIVTGSANKKIRDFGHDRLKTYGVGKGRDKKFWRQLIDELLAQKVIAKSEGLYPTIVLLPKAVQILKNEARVEIVRVLEKKSAKAGKQELSGSYDHELFDQLRELRKQIADEQGIPPYVVFSDRTLRDMASIFPENNEAMLSVSGVGEVKLDRYGRQFLNLINRYRSDHPERNALS